MDSESDIRKFVQDNLRELTKNTNTKFDAENLDTTAIDEFIHKHSKGDEIHAVSGDGWTLSPVSSGKGVITIHMEAFNAADKDVQVFLVPETIDDVVDDPDLLGEEDESSPFEDDDSLDELDDEDEDQFKDD